MSTESAKWWDFADELSMLTVDIDKLDCMVTEANYDLQWEFNNDGSKKDEELKARILNRMPATRTFIWIAIDILGSIKGKIEVLSDRAYEENRKITIAERAKSSGKTK